MGNQQLRKLTTVNTTKLIKADSAN
jgi:hypothetical protein